MGRKLDLSKLTDEEAKHVWEVVQRDFDLRKKEEERLEIVKIGSLEWYYEHVRSRFKRFGSAKVMRSLYGRLQHGQKMNPTLLGLHDRVYSLPDINSECQLHAGGGVGNDSDDEDDLMDGAKAEHYTRMRKTKRLLSVHPFDFELDSEYSAQSRRQSLQLSQTPVNQDGHQSFPDFPDAGEDTSRKETMIAEADLAAVFHQILQEQGQPMTPPEQEFSTEVRLTVNSRRKSLERNPKPGSPWNERHLPQYSADMDTSDEDVKGAQKIPVYQPHHVKRRNRASSQENINHSGNQIFELNKRMSAIERMLNRLEERILVHSEESLAPESHTDPDVEEEELKRKLEELASNISDKGVSSEEEEEKKKDEPKPEMSSSSSDPPSDAQKVCMTAGKTSGLDQTPRDLEERARHSGTTDSELSELEDKVASAAVQMQRAESEVSNIESRIAALSAAGLTVKPVEKPKKKYSTQLFMLQPPRNAGSSQGDQSTDSSEMASPNDFKVMSVPQVLRRKFNSSLEIADSNESFGRNSIYRGSLTQRNPNGKNRKADRIFAKPVVTHRP
ncbi:melanophilin isoform X9 [Dermochelys coriacea]|uniref:melanophilin isoform X9 n=1 Tax=Dermochelys coriacea TaxID=27794 RepID=UPI0018E8E782|nr:melanophilin isoform X9 [Dermochelys coriacea]